MIDSHCYSSGAVSVLSPAGGVYCTVVVGIVGVVVDDDGVDKSRRRGISPGGLYARGSNARGLSRNPQLSVAGRADTLGSIT